jgi:hypothetical protein
MKERVWKNNDSILPTVDFDLSLGGLLIIRGIVSRIEVLEGMIEAPLEEVSQYCRFCKCQPLETRREFNKSSLHLRR